jgi:hypothetical protein
MKRRSNLCTNGHNDMGHNSSCDLTANQSLEMLKSNGYEMQTATCLIHHSCGQAITHNCNELVELLTSKSSTVSCRFRFKGLGRASGAW